ncbi:hypothetical protein PVAP13_5KG628614 [Panicum virgatum]|uniref:Uncharacterized protein n=1 Tax=Panicum virgatum TaxID=38727 RepID=A0A8T0SYI4_PANVG|nr:hypothetical protein PVAP13_5KG628614 [Panicum virgatum]
MAMGGAQAQAVKHNTVESPSPPPASLGINAAESNRSDRTGRLGVVASLEPAAFTKTPPPPPPFFTNPPFPDSNRRRRHRASRDSPPAAACDHPSRLREPHLPPSPPLPSPLAVASGAEAELPRAGGSSSARRLRLRRLPGAANSGAGRRDPRSDVRIGAWV